jgi:hypothetical protein
MDSSAGGGAAVSATFAADCRLTVEEQPVASTSSTAKQKRIKKSLSLLA